MLVTYAVPRDGTISANMFHCYFMHFQRVFRKARLEFFLARSHFSVLSLEHLEFCTSHVTQACEHTLHRTIYAVIFCRRIVLDFSNSSVFIACSFNKIVAAFMRRHNIRCENACAKFVPKHVIYRIYGFHAIIIIILRLFSFWILRLFSFSVVSI